MVRNPFKSKINPKSFKRPEGAGNYDNMDDHNVVHTTSLLQGTIQHTPTADKDILNKGFTDGTYLELDGSNANQRVDLGAYGITVNSIYTDNLLSHDGTDRISFAGTGITLEQPTTLGNLDINIAGAITSTELIETTSTVRGDDGILIDDGTITQDGSTGDLVFTSDSNRFTFESMRIWGGNITDSSGAISFGNENLTTTGNITGKNGVFSSTTFPVVDIIRDTTVTGGNVFGAVKLERVMTGGTAQDGSGIAFYFKSPNDNGDSTFSGLFGGELTNVNDGAEIGSITFKPAWQGADPYNRVSDVDVMATSASTADLRVKTGRLAVGDIQYTVAPILNPAYSLISVEDDNNDILKMKVFTRLASTDDVAGIGFGVHTSSTVRAMKSSIFHQRKGSWGQGDMVFAVDAVADANDVATTDEKMRLKKDELSVQVAANIGDGGTTNYLSVASNGDLGFTGTAGFYPRRIRQAAEPASGTGATQIDVGEELIWVDSDDDTVWKMYNDTTAGIVKIKLE